MTDSISDQMYSAAVTQAEQAAVAAMNRDAEFARHTRQAMDLVAPPFDAASWPEPQSHHDLDNENMPWRL